MAHCAAVDSVLSVIFSVVYWSRKHAKLAGWAGVE